MEAIISNCIFQTQWDRIIVVEHFLAPVTSIGHWIHHGENKFRLFDNSSIVWTSCQSFNSTKWSSFSNISVISNLDLISSWRLRSCCELWIWDLRINRDMYTAEICFWIMHTHFLIYSYYSRCYVASKCFFLYPHNK